MRNHLDKKMLPAQLVYDIAKKYNVKSIEVLKAYNVFWEVFNRKIVQNKQHITNTEPERIYIPYLGALDIRVKTKRYFRNANFKKLQRSIAAIQSNCDDGEQV